jgi:nucleoside-diphosphate kinase
MLLVLEGPAVIARNREIMGATDPAKAAPNTLRKLYGLSISENVVHGSDAPATAREEIAWFFGESEIF